ncbi:unnamed protein product [Lepeophtheirus salmonis]|uniref:(salmon louse) hypothetical protein n=1 Tax=Lepeophtheirus salmonis TaxID=72036 RepID=A0A7R8HBY2_LEPSM|nr:unnamed protein product [Lepeophtheirus salmonis]CAF2991474.1 unnamed protein product [Lepeophtheirus salmonis]
MSTEQTCWIHIWVPSSDNGHLLPKASTTSFQVLPVKEDELLKKETKPKSVENDKECNDDNDIDPYADSTNSVALVEKESYESRLRYYLKNDLKNSRYTTRISDDGRSVLYSFQIKSINVESILIELTRRGFGTDKDTTVSVVQEHISLGSILPIDPSRNTFGEESEDKDGSSKEEGEDSKFYLSVKSRLMVAEVISRIRAGGNFTFDYCMLVILAGMIAFMGLVDNNSVTLVASMLVSPIMGPILAGIFGFVIQDSSLIIQGVRNELVSLLMCILIGMLFGIFVSLMILFDVYEVIDVSQWPSEEMLSRGRTKALITGIFVAIPSGAGIALSVLGGNAGSLVGVAISASLLPPAVNAGVYWAFSLLAAVYQGGYDGITSRPELECPLPTDAGISPSEARNNFLLFYHCDLAVDAFVSGFVSLTLTILNIICIIFTGYAILRIKEVTPDKIPQTFSNFWKRDIKAHRNYYKTLKTPLFNKMRPELNIFDGDNTHDLDGTFLQSIFNRAHKDEEYLDITRWVSMPQPPPVSNEQKLDINARAFEKIKEHTVADVKRRDYEHGFNLVQISSQEEKKE